MTITSSINKVIPLWKVKRFRNDYPRIIELLKKEFSSPIKLVLQRRLELLFSGFLSESFVIYGLDKNEVNLYLSDYQRFVRTARLNGRYTMILADKLIFDAVMRPYEQFIPKTYGIIKRGVIQWVQKPPELHSLNCFEKFLEINSGIVLKPIRGGGGAGIYLVTGGADGIRINGGVIDIDDFSQLISGLNEYLMEELIEQGDYTRDIYGKSINSIRVLTMWDSMSDQPFIAAAVQRIGTDRSFPVDNWSRGGLSAKIDLDTGMIGQAVSYPDKGKLVWFQQHPDTKKQIAGVNVPGWEIIKEQILGIAQKFPFLPYVGWDILVDSDGNLKILEGNHRSDVNLIQVHGPLLQNSLVKKFYREKGVIS
jgi:hypothetical protein